MAREYAKLLTRAWADDEFKALTGLAQRMYFQLISQPDMSMSGVVTLAKKRWSLQVSDQGEKDISRALAELEAGRFIVVDPGTQEVLVRSFIRADGGWKSPTTMKSIDSAVRATLSTRLKAVLRDEVAKLDLSKLSSKVSERTGKSTREVVEGIAWGIQADFEALSHTPTDTPSDTPSDGHNAISHETEPEPEHEHATEHEHAPSPGSLCDPEREDVAHLLDLLDREIEANGNRPPKRSKANRDAMRLLLDRDHRTPEQVAYVIRWCQADDFWQANILSASKLREKFDQLVAKIRSNHQRANRPSEKEQRNQDILNAFVAEEDHPYIEGIPA